MPKVAGQSQRAGTDIAQCNGSSRRSCPTDNRIKVKDPQTHLHILCYWSTCFKVQELSVEKTVLEWGIQCLNELCLICCQSVCVGHSREEMEDLGGICTAAYAKEANHSCEGIRLMVCVLAESWVQSTVLSHFVTLYLTLVISLFA